MALPAIIIRLAVVTAFAWAAGSAMAQDDWFPIKGADGAPVANHRVPIELESQIEQLAGIAVLDNPRCDVTL